MRRKDRKITTVEALAILDQGEYGVLSTVSSAQGPYGIPINYCLVNECLYFHCALEGKKIDHIRNDSRVSFCVVGQTEVLPDKFATRYESCIVQGLASEVFGEEKQGALAGLIRKYSEDFIAEGRRYIESSSDKTKVFRISMEDVSGKARK
ncbi:MAG TPA: pyridoxamine 5'-phosphate oxidase family protein [Proteobacteria bacterium]|nr:pyridoxamine 5'-phosphate oxidase family protein [Pseudomonadota bacterium]